MRASQNLFVILFVSYFLVTTLHAQTWSNLGSGVNDRSSSIIEHNGSMYAAGLFTLAGAIPANRIAKWDGVAWTALGTGVDDRINAALSFSGALYVAGDFQSAGGTPANRFAKWNGTSWESLAANTDIAGPAHALCVFNNELYAAGSAQGSNPASLTKWTGSTWTLIASFDNRINALQVYNGELYVGGQFTSAGNINADRIAKYNGTTWSTTGTYGLNNSVQCMKVYNNELYVGGSFTSLSNTTTAVNNIAKWNGTSWSSVGVGCNDWVLALETYQDRIYAAGVFTLAGGTIANHIASWDGTSWNSLGSGIDNNGFCLGKYNGDLIVAGTFSQAGGAAVSNIAKWNEGSTGVKNLSEFNSHVLIYPIPTTSKLFVKAPQDNVVFAVSLSSLTGQMLYENKNAGFDEEINMENFENGVYFLQIIQENKITSHKIIKNK